MDGVGGTSPNPESTNQHLEQTDGPGVQQSKGPEKRNLLDAVMDFLEKFTNLFTEKKNNEETDLNLPAESSGKTESIDRESKMKKIGGTIESLKISLRDKGNYGDRLDYYNRNLEKLDNDTLDKMSDTLSNLEMKLGSDHSLKITVGEPHGRRLYSHSKDEEVMHELNQLNGIIKSNESFGIIRKL